MKYFVTIGIFLFLTVIELLAQSDFRNGYIINNANDTIYGMIDYKGNKANSKKCILRKDDQSESQIFTPNEIRAYRFTDSKYYISKPVLTDEETKKLFLEYLINGIVDIYYYRDEDGEHYLLANEDGNLYELKNEEKEVFVNNTRYIKETKEYIGLLKATFRESSMISNRVDHINLTHKSLINLTRDYHNEICSEEECIVYEKELPKIKSIYGLVVGLNGILVSESGEFPDELYYMSNSQFEFNIFPSIGLYYKVNMPFINERLYFQYECTYSRMTLATTNSYIEPVYGMNYINDISVTQNTMNNFGFIKYEYPKGNIRPTFQVGGFLKYFFKTDYNRDLEVKYSWGETYYTNQTNVDPFQKLDFGINLGLGFKRIILENKEIFFDFRYQRGFGLLQGLNTNTFLINAGFQIGK